MESKKKILDIALYAGEIMLKNGGETYRAEDVMSRICQVCGIDRVVSFVTPTGMFLSIDDGQEDGYTYTFQKEINCREINLTKVSEINDFSRSFSPEKMTLDEAMAKLESIDRKKSYSIPLRTAFAGISTAAFTAANGGRPNDAACAVVIGMLMFLFVEMYGRIEKNDFIRTLIASAIGAFLAILSVLLGLCSDTQYILIGAIYILLPGIAITNAIRDSLSGDLLSGLVRVFEALVISGSIAIGVGIVLKMFGMF